MEKPTLSKGINPHALSPSEQTALVNRLYRVHNQIFDGVDLEHFTHYLLAPHAHRTRIHTYLNAQGETIG